MTFSDVERISIAIMSTEVQCMSNDALKHMVLSYLDKLINDCGMVVVIADLLVYHLSL